MIVGMSLRCLMSLSNCGVLQSRVGEHGQSLENIENMDNKVDEKHQTDDLKHAIHDSKYSFCQPDDSKHSI